MPEELRIFLTEQELLSRLGNMNERLADIWPPLYYLPKILQKEGREFLAVLIPGSAERPHFAGHSYVRVGSETRKASDEQFQRLLLQRGSKGRELEKMIGKLITWEMFGTNRGNEQAKLVDCNQFFVTVDMGTSQRCFPLDWITISFDPINKRYNLVVQHP